MIRSIPLGIALGLLGLALPAPAQDVRLTLPEGFDDLRGTLTEASLSLSLGSETPAAAQDYVAAARADYRRLLTGLYSEGYYGGTISIRIDGREAADIAPLDAPASVSRVAIEVDPGPRFSFGRAEVGPLVPGTLLPEGFASGQPARSDTIREAVDAAVSAWEEAGHGKARPADQDIVAVQLERRLDVGVTIFPGPALTFGTLRVEGNEDVRTERIREIVSITPGDPFAPSRVEAAAQRLRRTGTFQSVAFIEDEAIGPGDTLSYTLRVVEQVPRRIGAGAEISSTDGLTVSAFWLHRNLLGGAERFRIEGEVSQIGSGDGFAADGTDYALSASLSRPSTFRRDADLVATAEISRQDEPTFLLDSAGFEFGLTQYVRDDLTYQAGIGLLTAREETAFRERGYTLLTLPLVGTLEQRNDPLDATDGYFIDLEITPFLAVSGGDNGVRLYADGRAYRSFGTDDRFTLAARAQVGSVFGADLLEAPADFLFYSGGGGTVRGQPFQSLAIDGVADFGSGPTDVRTGGASFVGGQFEARLRITDTIGAVGFYDIGLVGSEALPSGDDEFHAGAGIGLRYRTGIGPIRLDIGTPTTGDRVGERLEVYIGIGQSF